MSKKLVDVTNKEGEATLTISFGREKRTPALSAAPLAGSEKTTSNINVKKPECMLVWNITILTRPHISTSLNEIVIFQLNQSVYSNKLV